MLRKLFKYDFIACGRQLVPLYAGVIIFAIAFRIFFGESTSVWLNSAFLVAVVVAVFIGEMSILDNSFNKCMCEDEAYLTMMLPVKSAMLIWGKILNAIVYVLIGIATVLIAFTIAGNFFWVLQSIDSAEFDYVSSIFLQTPAAFLLTGTHIIFSLVLQTMTFLSLGYLSNTVGMATSGRGYIISRLIFISIYVTVAAIGIKMLLNLSQISSADILLYVSSYGMFNLVIGISELLCVGVLGICFFGVNYILKNKVNLS